MATYDIAVIGAGPAGIMAAVSSSKNKVNVILVEKNSITGIKILVSGKGRCNITNTASIDTFIEKFGKQGPFLRSSFSTFFNTDLMDFFESRGLSLKKERQGRVFPITDRAGSIKKALDEYLKKCNVEVMCGVQVTDISKGTKLFNIKGTNGLNIYAKKIILSTGGPSYKKTHPTKDGLIIAKRLGHTVTPLTPALVPLKTSERWVYELKGLTLKNVQLTFVIDKKKIYSKIGELLFTHFGVSGPLILDLSGKITPFFKENKKIKLIIDLKPGLDAEKLKSKFLKITALKGKILFKNTLKEMLPQRLIPVFIKLCDIDPTKRLSQITKEERTRFISLLKALTLTVTDSLGMEYAMVTNGGISTKEIDPKSLESRIVSGLYFAGEIIDGCAPSGGYNLQQAFSTGYLAGEAASRA